MRVLVELDGKWYEWVKAPKGVDYCAECIASISSNLCCSLQNHCGSSGFMQETVQERYNKLLQDSAQCLDDCLMRIYPEEFSKENVDAALTRFSEQHGILSRVAGLADRLREVGR